MSHPINKTQLVETHLPCSACGSTDAKSIGADGHGYCFSCDTYFPPEGVEDQKFTYEFLPWRGVTKDTMAFYGVKTKIDEEGKPVAVGYRYPNEATKVRLLGQKAFYVEKNLRKESINGLFGADKFASGGHKTITITEGELDALSLYQATRSPVVSVQSSATAVRDCTNARSYLNAFERIYLAFDNDAIGREAVQAVARLFDPTKVFHVKFSNRKDSNEYVQAGCEDELKNLWLNAKKYLPERLKSSNEDFRKILEEPVKAGFPYPFKKLTDMTFGIRTGETVLFTAKEKVGKTEVMHFIEHKLLKETDSNVAAIFLEEPPARHLQSLVGIESGKPIHLPSHSSDPGQAYDTLERVLKRDDRLFLYSHFGSDDPEVLLDTIRLLVSAYGCRYVIFDHLSILGTGNSGEGDERRELDYISTRLEMMVKELDFALIMVMHVNDEGQTRGSRFPTKVADMTISIFRDLQSTDPVERSTWFLRVLYNRFCGQTGYAGKIIFHQDTYSFTEVDEDEHSQAPPMVSSSGPIQGKHSATFH